LVVAVTNDFSWVQITGEENGLPPVINPPARPAEACVTWRMVRGLPPIPGRWPRFQRLRAVEAIEDTPLEVVRAQGGYRVHLPKFDFMALLVVTRESRWPLPLPGRR
jgi:hypothetical protein